MTLVTGSRKRIQETPKYGDILEGEHTHITWSTNLITILTEYITTAATVLLSSVLPSELLAVTSVAPSILVREHPRVKTSGLSAQRYTTRWGHTVHTACH